MDLATLSREAIVTRLRNAAGVIALVNAGNIYGEAVPTDRQFPFVRVAPPVITPFPMACNASGRAYDFTIHAHTKAASMNEASAAGAAIDAEIADGPLLLEGGAKLWLTFTGGGLVSDVVSPGHWHWFGTYTAA